MELVGKLAILFTVFGAIAGSVSGLISGILPQIHASFALLVLIFMFWVSYRFIPNLLKIRAEEFPGGKWTGSEALKRGFFSFFIAWLILWILVYHLIV